MGLKIKFIQDDNMDHIEVIIRAKSQNSEVEKILSALGGESKNILVHDLLLSENMIDTNDIVIISKNGRYLIVKTLEGEYVLNEPLYKIEEKLDSVWFVKISQSEIINLKHVKQWNFDKGWLKL